ncbi:Manganese transport system membrane protein MntD [Phycisphaerales bacterium]|nr:Manganese transport system membrane protein MntD [Phycisphaerales bacterium]
MTAAISNLSLHASDWWTIGTAAVCGVACGVPGVYLVLRRMSMLGDAISHAILPGLAAAFLFFGTRDVLAMLAGAMATGMLTAWLSAGVARLGKVPEDAAMGVVFTSLFALGVLLITLGSRNVDLDPGCVLYGLIDAVALDTRDVLGVAVPRSFLILSVFAVLNVSLVGVFYKELKIVSFDSALASALGFRSGVVHYTLLAMIAATCVASFEAVGSILVVAMLIVPGATAYLLTDRLSRMLVIAAVVACVAAFAGHLLALATGAAVAGAVSVALGGLFAGAALFSPRYGVVARALRRAALALRIRREDALANLYRAHEGRAAETRRAPGLLDHVAAWALRRQGLVVAKDGVSALTDAGLARARTLIRSHRLWETYLAERVGLPADHLHDPAHRVEHFITDELRGELAGDVGTDVDPQGREIPPDRRAEGEP